MSSSQENASREKSVMASNSEKSGNQNGKTIAADLADLYDGVVDQYVQEFFSDLTDAPWLDRFAEIVVPGGRILDVGCGPGNFASYLVGKGFAVDGIDISAGMIGAAKKLVPRGAFTVMNCSDLTFEDNSFDGILVAYSLLHLTKDDARKSLLEFSRTLKPGGMLCLLLKEGTGEHQLPASLAPGRTCFVQLWSQGEMTKLLTPMGFDVVQEDSGSPTSDKELQFRKLMLIARRT